MNVGNPVVWIMRSRVCMISSSVAPASRALVMCVSRAILWLLAPDIATFMSHRVFSESGPDFSWIMFPQSFVGFINSRKFLFKLFESIMDIFHNKPYLPLFEFATVQSWFDLLSNYSASPIFVNSST